jgi:hypothetical protein
MTDNAELAVLIVPATICKMSAKNDSIDQDEVNIMDCFECSYIKETFCIEDSHHANILRLFSQDCFCGEYLGFFVGGTVSFLLHLVFIIPYQLVALILWAFDGFDREGSSVRRIDKCNSVLLIPLRCCSKFSIHSPCLSMQQSCNSV